jgi:hypothetical protein
LSLFEELFRRFFAARGKKAVVSLAHTFLGDDREILGITDDKAVVRRAMAMEMQLPLLFAIGYKAAVLLIEYGMPPVAPKWRRFSRLPLRKRLLVLEDWECGLSMMRRNMVKLMKFIILSSVLADEELLVWTGYGDAMRARFSGECASMAHAGKEKA